MLLLPLILTVMLEGLVLFLLRERSIGTFVFFAALNTATNLSLNLFIQLYSFASVLGYHLIVFALELLIVALEAALYFLYTGNFKKSVKYSFFCNLTSYLAGFFILLIINF